MPQNKVFLAFLYPSKNPATEIFFRYFLIAPICLEYALALSGFLSAPFSCMTDFVIFYPSLYFTPVISNDIAMFNKWRPVSFNTPALDSGNGQAKMIGQSFGCQIIGHGCPRSSWVRLVFTRDSIHASISLASHPTARFPSKIGLGKSLLFA